MNTITTILTIYVIAIAIFGATYHSLDTKPALTQNEIRILAIADKANHVLVKPIYTIVRITKCVSKIGMKLARTIYYRKRARKVFGI